MTIRSDIETATIESRARDKKKKKIKTAGFLGDMYDLATGKKKTRLQNENKRIGDILEDPKKKLERELREEAEAAEAETQDS